MFELVRQLEQASEIIDERAELRALGLTEDEVDGHQLFFLENSLCIPGSLAYLIKKRDEANDLRV